MPQPVARYLDRLHHTGGDDRAFVLDFGEHRHFGKKRAGADFGGHRRAVGGQLKRRAIDDQMGTVRALSSTCNDFPFAIHAPGIHEYDGLK
jgi:hypothetical protein